MKKKMLTLLFLPVFSFFLLAQKYDKHWVLGPYYDKFSPELYNPIELIFDDGSFMTNSFQNSVSMNLSAITISSKSGKLLFYTNGNHIESANNKRMKNGDGLNPGSWGEDTSTENLWDYFFAYSYVVVPDPIDTSIFYLLHLYCNVDNDYYTFTSSKLQITKIDMSKNNGDGEVIYKNKTLADVYSGRMLSVNLHANGVDWWIMLRHPNGNSYNELLLHRDSIIQNNLIKFPAIKLTDDNDIINTATFPAFFSSSGEIMADIFSQTTVRIFDFDRCTGNVNLRDTLNVPIDTVELVNPVSYYTDGIYWCMFSPSNQYMYISGINGIKQYDLSFQNVGDSRIKVSNKINQVDENKEPVENDFIAGFGVPAPDGKLYIIEGFNNHAINDPDEKGLACNFCSQYDCLGFIRSIPLAPSYPNYRLGPLKGSPCDTVLSINTPTEKDYSLKFYPNPSKAQIKVEITLPDYNSKEIPILEVIDMFGKKVYEYKFPAYAYLHIIQEGTLIPGSYIASIKLSGKVVKSDLLIIN